VEKRIVVGFSLVFLTLLLGSLLAACNQPGEDTTAPEGGAPDTSALDGEALAMERCSTHHDFDRVSSAKKSADGWKANVERMVAKGAKLNAEEQAAVIAFLTEAYPE
jgi:hypothetical protein